jgi:hypothetical protein
MIDFDQIARLIADVRPLPQTLAPILRKLAADVLEEAAKEFDVSPHTQWHEHEIAEWLRTRAAELVKP